MRTQYPSYEYDSVIGDLGTDSTLNAEIIVTTPNNLDEGKKLIYSYHNNSDQDAEIKASFSAILKPGSSINVTEEGKLEENEVFFPKWNLGTKDKYVIINDTQTDSNIGLRSRIRSPKFDQWLSVAEEQLTVAYHKINQLERSLEEQNTVIADLDGKVAQGTIKEEARAMMFKYGFIPYLVFLFVSLAVFLVSGTMYFIWRFTSNAIINPGSLFIVSVMGFGWTITAIAGLISVKRRSEA